MNRFASGKFSGQYKATIGADFLTKEAVVEDAYCQRHLVGLQIWDTAGQERFQSLGVGFYRGADAAMLVYDITDAASLENLDHWRKEFLQQVGGRLGLDNDPAAQFPFVVVGNKSDKDKDRMIPLARAEEWCVQAAGATIMGSQPLPHFSASAKTSHGVEDAFMEVARRALTYEEYRRRSQPQLFVPPLTDPIDLRRQQSSMSEDPPGCC